MSSHQPLPIAKDFSLITKPAQTWDQLAASQRGWVFAFFYYLLPLILLAAVAEGCGLYRSGQEHLSLGASVNRFSSSRIIAFELVQWLMIFGLLALAAWCIKGFANACHRRNHSAQSVYLLVHGIGPLVLLKIFDGIPELNVWAIWFLGIMFTMSTLYHGVPRIMQPDPPSAFGLYIASAFTILFFSFIGRLLTYWYLNNDSKLLNAGVARLAAWIP